MTLDAATTPPQSYKGIKILCRCGNFTLCICAALFFIVPWDYKLLASVNILLSLFYLVMFAFYADRLDVFSNGERKWATVAIFMSLIVVGVRSAFDMTPVNWSQAIVPIFVAIGVGIAILLMFSIGRKKDVKSIIAVCLIVAMYAPGAVFQVNSLFSRRTMAYNATITGLSVEKRLNSRGIGYDIFFAVFKTHTGTKKLKISRTVYSELTAWGPAYYVWTKGGLGIDTHALYPVSWLDE